MITSVRGPLLLVILFGLNACSGVPSRAPVADLEQAWQHYQRQARAVNAWEMDGRIAIRTAEDGWTAGLYWRHSVADYELRLSGPFGQGGVRLVGDGGGATLFDADGGAYRASTPEHLLYRHTGWWLPVSGLRFWVRGLPVPGVSAEMQWDDFGRLAQLTQDDWVIRYRRYARFNQRELPGKIALENHRLKVRLVIDAWGLPDGAQQG